MSTPVNPTPVSTTTFPMLAPPGPWVGLDTSEPRYVTSGILGGGGMGEVSLCRDRRMGRDVAMKVMRPRALAQPELHARFLREALVQGQLEHPSIVPVYDVGVDEGGTAYFTMRRVRGTTLSSILKRLRAKSRETELRYSRHKLLTAFASVCLVIDFAHTRGVLHRDLKPSNIMLGDFGEVYVLDWGIAKVDPPDASDTLATTVRTPVSDATAVGEVLGTPGYMSPEQLRGDPLDPRTDVYALGAVLFEILALKKLHDGKSRDELAASTLRGSDARPSARAPECEVPPELEAICLKATAHAKGDRFASARELHAALERFLEGDRDLDRRRHMAREHARRGALAGERAIADGAGAAMLRAQAMRELGRALVLDPENAVAADTLVQLLTKEPKEVPEEVRAEIAKENQQLLRVRARWGARGYAGWFFILPFVVAAGVRSYAALTLVTLAWALAIAGYVVVHRHPTREGTTPLPLQILAGVAVASASVLVGPLVFVPTVAVSTAYGMALGAPSSRGSRARRWGTVLINCLSLVVPCALEWAGIVRPAYGFAGEAMLILPRAVDLPPVLTPALILAASLLAIVEVTLLAHEFRDALSQAQRRVHLYAWQLRQLLPKSAPWC
jgi:eukaryotic-like serine/threonine-protein kinase